MAKNYSSRPPGMKAIRLDLDEHEHQEFRVLAAQNAMTMSQYARAIIREHLQRQKGKKKGASNG